MYITVKHIALIRLRKEGYTRQEISILIDEPLTKIIRWGNLLRKMFGPLPKPDFSVSYPCEICGLRLRYSPAVLPQRVRCRKHRYPMIWLDPETPAYTNKREYDRYLYRTSEKRHSATARNTLKWVHKKKATDPEWVARYRQYHAEWHKKRMLKFKQNRAQSEGT